MELILCYAAFTARDPTPHAPLPRQSSFICVTGVNGARMNAGCAARCAVCTCWRWNAQIGDSEWKDGMGGGGWLVAGPLYCIADTRLRGIMQSKHKRSEHQSNNQKEKAFFKAEKFYNSSGTTGSIFYL